MPEVWAYGATAESAPLAPLTIFRREVGPRDVAIEILFCGVCHSDLHTVRGDWGQENWPIVPGHEIVGKVMSVGAEVEGFAEGEVVGVGVMVDSCRSCEACERGDEQYCEGMVFTYDSPDLVSGGITQGGYSEGIVVDQDFVLRISPDADLAATAPLLCAGITTYSPLRHWQVGSGTAVGIVGLGGLGHMATKLAKAMGATVTVFSTSPAKEADALALGADRVVISTDSAAMAAVGRSLDLILDTVAATHDLDSLLGTLRQDGSLVLVGAPAEPDVSFGLYELLAHRNSVAGSSIGSVAETQEMLDFCAEHGITAEIEMIAMAEIETAFRRLQAGDVRFRFVINLATLDQ